MYLALHCPAFDSLGFKLREDSAEELEVFAQNSVRHELVNCKFVRKLLLVRRNERLEGLKDVALRYEERGLSQSASVSIPTQAARR